MSDQPALMIAIGVPDPDGQEHLAAYAAAAGELAAANGAKPVGRYKVARTLAGEDFPGIVAILEFPSAQALDDAFASEAYQKLIPGRDKGFKELQIFRAEPA